MVDLDTIKFLDIRRQLYLLRTNRGFYLLFGVVIMVAASCGMLEIMHSFVPIAQLYLSGQKNYTSLMNTASLNTTQIKSLITLTNFQSLYPIAIIGLCLSLIITIVTLLAGWWMVDKGIDLYHKHKAMLAEFEKHYEKELDAMEVWNRKHEHNLNYK